MFSHSLISLDTRKRIIDVTQQLRDWLSGTGLRNGLVCVSSMHTTLGIKIYENEALLLKDTKNALEKFAPRDASYLHDDIHCRNVPMDEPINGHSHIKSLLMDSSVTVPLVDGILQLGKWQRVLVFELDDDRPRQIMFSANGES
jgi:secondary thiamine-phosphate synthase enzyme